MLPLFYHAHTSQFSQDIPFWVELARQSQGPIMELGCGTGRVLLELARLEKYVIGIDRDRAMLAFLKSRLEVAEQSHILVLQADITGIPFEMQFGLLTLPCNTYSSLSTEVRLVLLSRVHSLLNSNGTFAFSVPNPILISSLTSQMESKIEDIFLNPLDGEPVQVSSHWQRSESHITIYWNYDHLLADGQVKRYQLINQQYLVEPTLYMDELRDAGLRPLSIFGDYDKTPYKEDSPQLIIIASPT